jgi:hypothetical protein
MARKNVLSPTSLTRIAKNEVVKPVRREADLAVVSAN